MFSRGSSTSRPLTIPEGTAIGGGGWLHWELGSSYLLFYSFGPTRLQTDLREGCPQLSILDASIPHLCVWGEEGVAAELASGCDRPPTPTPASADRGSYLLQPTLQAPILSGAGLAFSRTIASLTVSPLCTSWLQRSWGREDSEC